MSQDAPPVSRKDKKAQRDADRKKQGKKRKHAETIAEDEASVQQQAKNDLVVAHGADESAAVPATKKSTKRKRSDQEAPDEVASAPESAAPKPKKRKPAKSEAGAGANEEGEASSAAEDSTTKSRFILFIGNLPYNTTDASLDAHFKSLKPFTLRHRTDPKTKKSKGFAFLEFENYDRMKTCLKLYHHSMFDPAESVVGGAGKGNGKGGRRINVELTAGGGGKAEGRKDKIRVKNVRLEDQRRRRAELEMKEKAKSERKGGAVGKKPARREPEVSEAPVEGDSVGMHPSRLARLKG